MLHSLGRGAAIVVLYILVAQLGLLFSFIDGNVSPIWLPSGVSVLALLVFGRRVLWACWLANVVVSVGGGMSLPVALVFACGNCVEYLLAAFLLQRFAPRLEHFGSLRDVGVLLLAGGVAPIPAALCATTTLVLVNIAPVQVSPFVALTWWAGDAVGILILVPSVLVWYRLREKRALQSKVSVAALSWYGGGSLALAMLVFSDPLSLAEHGMVLVYALFLLVMWGALRLGILGATLGVLAVVMPAVVLTAAGHGPFVRHELNDTILLLMGFMVVSLIMALALSAVLIERDTAAEQARVLSKAVEQSASAVIITNPAGQITYVNPAFSALTGYESAEAIGQNPRFLKSGHTSGEEYASLWKAIIDGRSWRGEFLNICKDRSLVWEQMTISPLRDENGRISHFVSTAEDITQRKVNERHLRDALERAERARAELERITFAITHTLQEPLRSISGFAQLLERRYTPVLDATAQGYLGRVVNATERMYHLFHDLMHYVMVDDGSPHQPVGLETVIGNVCGALGADAVSVRVAGPLPVVMAAERQIHHVFEHILGNSVKYRDSERPLEIIVSAWPVETEESRIRKANGLPASAAEYWELSIQDNGIGIDPVFQPKLFMLFSRLHTIDDYDGTGVGLAYCRRVIERHGGRVWIESRLGVGTTVHLTLPLTLPAQKAELEER